MESASVSGLLPLRSPITFEENDITSSWISDRLNYFLSEFNTQVHRKD